MTPTFFSDDSFSVSSKESDDKSACSEDCGTGSKWTVRTAMYGLPNVLHRNIKQCCTCGRMTPWVIYYHSTYGARICANCMTEFERLAVALYCIELMENT